MFNMDQITILSNNEMSEELCSYYKDLLNVKSLYNKGITGKNLICAVIDSGCDINHPVFKDENTEIQRPACPEVCSLWEMRQE